MEFTHNDTGNGEEGPVQYFIVPTQELTDYEHVFVSLWAVNKVIHPIKTLMTYIYLVPSSDIHILSSVK